jgi:undecaprenyl diphosphate synthase
MSRPNHVAIIMDGNGRWAERRGRPRLFGHVKGAKNVKHVVTSFANLKIPFLTLFAFSTENWNRPTEEIDILMRLLFKFLRRETKELHEQNIRLRVIGNIQSLSPHIQAEIKKSEELTLKNTGLVLTLAFSYGGRQEILQSIQSIAQDILDKKLLPENINESFFESHMQSNFLPDPDLIIRTSGEYRLSNFLIWQSAYSEIFVTNTCWPEYGSKDISEALINFSQRERRYGKTSSQVGSTEPKELRELNY